jgi:hypothetical protein
VEQAKRDVLHRVEVVEQMERLEDEAEAARPDPGQLGVGQARYLFPGDGDGAARRALQRARHVQQGRLARARRAEERDPLGGRDPEGDGRERAHWR